MVAKIAFENLLTAQAGRLSKTAFENMIIRARVALVIADNKVNETNNSSVNFRKFAGAIGT